MSRPPEGPRKAPTRKPDPRFIEINGIKALRWNVKNAPTP